MVKGFEAKVLKQKEQILVKDYKSQDNFLVRLLCKDDKEKIYLFKTGSKLTP